jgi:voltage-gated potassium channel
MGYFFRRSARIGPFRLNFSKSGIGASVGVKGVRLTMTPRGTTYVTAGSHGFYYRETLPKLGSTQAGSNAPISLPPRFGGDEEEISSASASDLVDSSSERLVQQLNDRAQMFNPAWLLYAAAAITLCGLAVVPDAPTAPTFPKLPDVSSPFDAARADNTTDEYAMLTARYGEPDSILISETVVPIGTARYNSAHVDILFVPVGCVEAYEQAVQSLGSRPHHPSAQSKSRIKRVKPCTPSRDTGWTTVKYINSAENYEISTDIATARLDRIATRRSSPPVAEHGGLIKTRPHQRPEMQSTSQARAAVERVRKDFEQTTKSIEADARHAIYLRVASVLIALGIFVAGIIVHRTNTEKRTSRLFYELGEAEQQRFGVVQDTFAHLGKSHRTWRIKGESSTRDWKRNAGASSLVKRVPITVGCAPPQRVQANVAVPCIDLGHAKLFFLPDVVLYWEGGTFGAINPPARWVQLADWVVWAVFLLEYIIMVAIDRPHIQYVKRNPLNLAVIALSYPQLPVLFGLFRLARLTRFLRLLRLVGVTVRAVDALRTILWRRGVVCVAAISMFIILGGGTALTLLEPQTVRGGFADGIWWAIVTASTVGYGDIAPSTILGRLIAVLLMLSGVGLISTLAASITAYFLGQEESAMLTELNERTVRIERMLSALLADRRSMLEDVGREVRQNAGVDELLTHQKATARE